MEIVWVESNFRNPTERVWANLDDPLKKIIMQLMQSWDESLRPYVALSRR